ncbi:MAG: type II toxin-antitoxin system HicB family antitoxin [Methanospirillum sp.]
MVRYQLTAVVWEEDGVYVSKCLELEVASCGDTPKEALAMLREAIDLFLEDAETYGMLDELTGLLKAQEKYTTTIEVETA